MKHFKGNNSLAPALQFVLFTDFFIDSKPVKTAPACIIYRCLAVSQLLLIQQSHVLRFRDPCSVLG